MEKKPKFNSITALKGLFIFLIVIHNTLSIIPLFNTVPGISFIILFGGTLGNSMFFLLSGFLLNYSYKKPISNKSISFPQFLESLFAIRKPELVS